MTPYGGLWLSKTENVAEKTEFLDIRNVVKKLGLLKQR